MPDLSASVRDGYISFANAYASSENGTSPSSAIAAAIVSLTVSFTTISLQAFFTLISTVVPVMRAAPFAMSLILSKISLAWSARGALI